MSRTFAPITPGDLQRKFLDEFISVHEFLYGNSLARQDLQKVDFDGENSADSADEVFQDELKSIMGLNTLDNGLTYWGMEAGGDWEHPVYFIIYWDGENLRGYVPKDGNVWNYKTKSAFGNDGTSYEDGGNFDVQKIIGDIQKRIILKTNLTKPQSIKATKSPKLKTWPAPQQQSSLADYSDAELLEELRNRLGCK